MKVVANFSGLITSTKFNVLSTWGCVIFRLEMTDRFRRSVTPLAISPDKCMTPLCSYVRGKSRGVWCKGYRRVEPHGGGEGFRNLTAPVDRGAVRLESHLTGLYRLVTVLGYEPPPVLLCVHGRHKLET